MKRTGTPARSGIDDQLARIWFDCIRKAHERVTAPSLMFAIQVEMCDAGSGWVMATHCLHAERRDRSNGAHNRAEQINPQDTDVSRENVRRQAARGVRTRPR